MNPQDNFAIERFKLFKGPVNRNMPLLLSGKNEKGEVVDAPRAPMSAYDFMKQYVRVFNLRMNPTYFSLLYTLEDNHLFTGDEAARHSDGRMKVAPATSYLRLLTPETRLVNGAVDLSDDYAALAGEEFSKANVDKYCGMPLNKSAAKKNPIWLALAKGDKALLDEFVDARFTRQMEIFKFDHDIMGIFPPPIPKKGASGRLWAVYGLLHHLDASRASGDDRLDYYGGRLVGEAQEAQRAAAGQLGPTLEQRI